MKKFENKPTDLQTKLNIAGESTAALLRSVGEHTVAMVDMPNAERPLSTGVLVRVGDCVLIATARHCVPHSPTGKLWIVPTVPKTPAEGMIGFVRSVKHPGLDLAVLKITRDSLEKYIPSKTPLDLSRIVLAGHGQETRPMGVCGCPRQFYDGDGTPENPGRALMNFYSTAVFEIDNFPEVPVGDRAADPETDIFYEYANEGQLLKTDQMIELTNPEGFSGGGVWELGFEECKIWSPDSGRLFGIQSKWLESARYVRAIQILHWLTLVALTFPDDCRPVIADHFSSLQLGDKP